MTSNIRCDFSTVREESFCGKVLLGTWFEKQCKYVKNPHDFKSTYMVDYDPKPPSHGGNKEFVWDQNLRDQGYGARILFDHQAPNFLENMSSTHDLVYNHMTKLGSDGPNIRKYRSRMARYEPVQDYTQNYGNITNFGLQEIYKERLRSEAPNPRTTSTTTYQDDYPAPKPEKYTFRRWGMPKPNSSAMVPTNNIMIHLQLRDKQLNVLPDKKLEHHRPLEPEYEPRCNPITWTCPDTYKPFPDKCAELPKGRRPRPLALHFYRQ